MSPHRALVLAVVGITFSGALSFGSPAAAAPSAPIAITACGQQIPNGKTGFLSADLTCPTAIGGPGVRLGRRSKLDLGGFTLTGGDVAVACEPVICDGLGCRAGKSGRCEVFGGTIKGAANHGVIGGSITLRNVSIVDCYNYAALAFQSVDAYDSHVVNTPNGFQGNRRVRVYGSTLDNASINSRVVLLYSSSVTNNTHFGVVGRDIRLFSSSVTGNGWVPLCSINTTCADLYTTIEPRVDATSTCGKSVKIPSGPNTPEETWGVCMLD